MLRLKKIARALCTDPNRTFSVNCRQTLAYPPWRNLRCYPTIVRCQFPSRIASGVAALFPPHPAPESRGRAASSYRGSDLDDMLHLGGGWTDVEVR